MRHTVQDQSKIIDRAVISSHLPTDSGTKIRKVNTTRLWSAFFLEWNGRTSSLDSIGIAVLRFASGNGRFAVHIQGGLSNNQQNSPLTGVCKLSDESASERDFSTDEFHKITDQY